MSGEVSAAQTEQLGIAILGAGRWGRHLVRNFLEHPQARVVAIADVHPEHLHAMSQQFSLDPDVQLTTDWEAVLQLPEVQGVAIATPATTHYTLVKAALTQNLHVLAEKPLTLSWQECLTLARLADEQQRQLVVDHTYLFHPAVMQGKTVVQTGTLGELRYGYATRTHLGPIRQDVDALWDLAIHDIAIFSHWLGAYPNQVQAQGTIWLQGKSPDQHLFPQGLSDLVWLKLIYPNGFHAFIHLCWCNPDKQRRLCMVGNQGTLIFDELVKTTPLTLQQGQLEFHGTHLNPVNQRTHSLPGAPLEPLQHVCDHFLTCVRQNTRSAISCGRVGAHLVQILCALTESLKQGGQVVDVGIEGDR